MNEAMAQDRLHDYPENHAEALMAVAASSEFIEWQRAEREGSQIRRRLLHDLSRRITAPGQYVILGTFIIPKAFPYHFFDRTRPTQRAKDFFRPHFDVLEFYTERGEELRLLFKGSSASSATLRQEKPMPEKMTGQQRKKLFALCKQLGMNDLQRKDAAASYTGGIPSFSALTKAQAAAMIDDLEGKSGNRPSPLFTLASAAQRHLIHKLAVVDLRIDEARLNGFIAKVTGGRKHSVAELGKFEAIKVIDGLKAVVKRGGFTDRA